MTSTRKRVGEVLKFVTVLRILLILNKISIPICGCWGGCHKIGYFL